MSFILAIEQYRHLKVSQKGTAFTVFAKAFNRTLRQRRSTHKRRRARSITVRALPGTAFLSNFSRRKGFACYSIIPVLSINR